MFFNEGPLYVTDIAQLLMAIGRDLPFPIELSPSRSREVTSEGHKALGNFEAN